MQKRHVLLSVFVYLCILVNFNKMSVASKSPQNCHTFINEFHSLKGQCAVVSSKFVMVINRLSLRKLVHAIENDVCTFKNDEKFYWNNFDIFKLCGSLFASL